VRNRPARGEQRDGAAEGWSRAGTCWPRRPGLSGVAVSAWECLDRTIHHALTGGDEGALRSGMRPPRRGVNAAMPVLLVNSATMLVRFRTPGRRIEGGTHRVLHERIGG